MRHLVIGLSIAMVLAILPLKLLRAEKVKPDTTVSGKVFLLGEVVVSGDRDRSDDNTLSAGKIVAYNRADVSRALNLLPGLTLNSVGNRNESTVFIRGFDLRQVPLFVDGIPVYVPYDGYVDLARFTTADIAQISVAKGFSSVLFGPNTEGGAINLVTRKPEAKLDYSLRSGMMTGRGYQAILNVGSRQEKYYIQGGASRLKRDYYRMSSDFKPVATEDGGRRVNSDRDDIKFSAKLGFVPNATDEYAIVYTNQQGEKGNPVYTGSDPATRPRYWRWPQWDKQSVYFISRTSAREKASVTTRLFYDTFLNTLDAYDDATYTTQKKASSFKSIYDDYTYGASGEVAAQVARRSTLKVAAHFKRDVHREHNLGEPVREMSDNTVSVGLESFHRVTEKLSIEPGISFNRRNSIRAEDYNSTTKTIGSYPDNDNSAVNAQIGAFLAIDKTQGINLSVARKTRFAVMKDRYSYKMGAAIPNPDLKSEASINYDAGYNYSAPDGKVAVQAGLFYNDIRDIIARVDNVKPPNIYQLQNAGKARFFGVELGLILRPVKEMKSSLSYSYVNRKNVTNPAIKLVDVPDQKILASLTLTPVRQIDLDLNAEYNTSRYSTSTGLKVDAFGLLNAKVTGKPRAGISVEAGAHNLMDRNYSLSDGYPEEGRSFFFNVLFGTP